MITPERRAQMDAVLGVQSAQKSTLTPERRAQMDAVLGTSTPEPEQKSIGGFIKNIGKSAVSNVAQIGSAILSPIQTAKNIGKLAVGTAQLAIPGEQGYEQSARDVGQFYKQRYGSLKNIGETLYNDPVGALLDVSTVAGGVGTAAKLGKFGKVAEVAGNIERVTNPLSLAGKLVSPISEKVLSPVTSYIKETTPIKSVSSLFRDRATMSLNRTTPAKFASSSIKGLDVNELTRKYFTPGAGYDEILGDIPSRGTRGSLNSAMKKAESVIQQQIKKGGVIDIKPFVNGLETDLSLLNKIPGNELKIKNLEKFIKSTSEKYPDGIPVEDALAIKRAVDSQFGSKAAKKITTTSTGQEKLASYSREQLKKMFPKAKQALRTEEEIYSLRPILNSARGIVNTQGSTIRKGVFGNLDLGKPSTLITAPIDALLSNPKTASYVAQGKLPPINLTSKVKKPIAIFKKAVKFGKYGRLFGKKEEGD